MRCLLKIGVRGVVVQRAVVGFVWLVLDDVVVVAVDGGGEVADCLGDVWYAAFDIRVDMARSFDS